MKNLNNKNNIYVKYKQKINKILKNYNIIMRLNAN